MSSWIKQKIDNYLLKRLGNKAIFDQEMTLEIKKKNDYYEEQLALPEVLRQLSTPAPVVGDITTMTDPLPGVRLPRIPYYEYIYYLMRWNSSVLRMIGIKLKQEIFRETRLHGLLWEGKFKTKCADCGTEFDEQLEACDYCHSENVHVPDPHQKKLLDPFIQQANKAEQTLLETFEELEDDLNTVDDCYLIFIKDYFVGPTGIFGQLKEIMRGDTSRFRIVSDIAGRRGGKWWVCPAHRNAALEPDEYEKKKICPICALPLQEVHYVETTVGGVTPQKYYIAGEVVHCSKYEPSRLYGIPPIFSVYIVARTIQLMDIYTEELYEKGRLKGLLGIATDNKNELKKWIDETMTRLRSDLHYQPVIALDVGPDGGKSRMEFIRLIDNMDELRFHEHRKMLKEEIAGLFGVDLIFLADASIGGGLNNEGLRITVTDRTIEWGQSIYHDQIFPNILEALSITDWRIKLKPSKETDEMAELQRFNQRVETAGKLQQMGYELELKDDKFEIRGKAFLVEAPQQFGSPNDALPGSQGSSQKLLPEAQEAKPDKLKPDKEIQRSESADFKIRNLTDSIFAHKWLLRNESKIKKLDGKVTIKLFEQAGRGKEQKFQIKDVNDSIFVSKWIQKHQRDIQFIDGQIKVIWEESSKEGFTKSSDSLTDEMKEHLSQAFRNPANYIYVDSPEKAKGYGPDPSPGSPNAGKRMKVFDMERVNDESGTSGTGLVLSGIIFPDGKVVIRWNTETASTTEFDSWEDFEAIHIGKHPGNETKIYFYDLKAADMIDFAKSVLEPGKKVMAEYKEIEDNFAKQLEEIYLQKLAKNIAKLDDKSPKRLMQEVDAIVDEASPLIEKLAFSEVLRAYKQGKKIDEST